MSNISFEDQKYRSQGVDKILSAYASENSRGFVGWLVRKGFVKSKKKAEIIITVLTITFFLLAVFFVFGFGGSDYDLPEGYEIIYPEGEPIKLNKPLYDSSS